MTPLRAPMSFASTALCLYCNCTLSVSDSNNANTKKTVRNCDITHIKIKSFLYSWEYVNEMAGPISATLRLGAGQYSKMLSDEQISDIAK